MEKHLRSSNAIVIIMKLLFVFFMVLLFMSSWLSRSNYIQASTSPLQETEKSLLLVEEGKYNEADIHVFHPIPANDSSDNEGIQDEATPLSRGSLGNWSLCSFLYVIGNIIIVFYAFFIRWKKEEGIQYTLKKEKWITYVMLINTSMSCLIFWLTNDFSGKMIINNHSCITLLIFFIVQMACFSIIYIKKNEAIY